MAGIFRKAGIRYQTQAQLPGTPDFYLTGTRVVVFVDGNYWHGFNFVAWRWRLAPEWRTKIKATMQRDRQVNRKLRAAGWKVVRVWEHMLIRNPREALLRVTAALG
jgi:DNA mismatch endonuclease (patch repair protein)